MRQLSTPPVTLRNHLPEPIFPPRTAGAPHLANQTLSLDFLGHQKAFPIGHINWQAPSLASEHQLWRMNLHYMEYLEALDTKAVEALITDWMNANDALRPGAWRDAWNAYAVSLRIVVWMQQLAARQGFSKEARNLIAQSIARQTLYLEKTLETDIGGNHLIKNIKALIWASACFEGPDAIRWGKLGRELLMQQLNVQILPDGVHYERSPSYHCQVFADLLECRSVLGRKLPALDEALTGMAQAAADLAHPDGYVAQFNDAGLTMCYKPGTCLDAYEGVFGACPSPRASFAFPDAGYFGYRDTRLTIIADCGALAPDDLPAHGHGDALSFELSLDGQRLIVDQGVFEYISGERRKHSRSAAFHNTLWVTGTDQADFFGAFRIGRRASVALETYETTADGLRLEGHHTGYAQALGTPKTHRRIDINNNGITLTDWTEATAPIPAQSGLLLHPQISVAHQNDGLHLTLPSGAACLVTSGQPISLQKAVWWPDMGQEHPTHRLIFTTSDARSPAQIRISLLPASEDTDHAISSPTIYKSKVKQTEAAHSKGPTP